MLVFLVKGKRKYPPLDLETFSRKLESVGFPVKGDTKTTHVLPFTGKPALSILREKVSR